jgi:hypothetical protein
MQPRLPTPGDAATEPASSLPAYLVAVDLSGLLDALVSAAQLRKAAPSVQTRSFFGVQHCAAVSRCRLFAAEPYATLVLCFHVRHHAVADAVIRRNAVHDAVFVPVP